MIQRSWFLQSKRLVATCAFFALPLMACGAIVFEGAAPIAVTGTPPAPPPPPEPVEPPPPPPPPPPTRVTVSADHIEITEMIQFDVNLATIKTESHGLLNEIVEVFKAHPEIKKVSIEGHTDGDGPAAKNKTLSEQRAASVMAYLVEHGVEASRMTSKGLGETKPIGDNNTPEGKEKNRRVEFVITQQEEVQKVFEVDPATGERREVQGGKQLSIKKDGAR